MPWSDRFRCSQKCSLLLSAKPRRRAGQSFRLVVSLSRGHGGRAANVSRLLDGCEIEVLEVFRRNERVSFGQSAKTRLALLM
jgi:hypothetical protein